MNSSDPFDNASIRRLQLFIYLLPIFGFFPALWTLYRRHGDRHHQAVSRLAVTLALAWVLGYGLLGVGVQLSAPGVDAEPQLANLRFLLMGGFLTSSYFFINFWLMVRLWQRRSIKLPGMTAIAEHLP